MSGVDDLCRSYLDLRWFFDPAAASTAGLDTYDGKLGRFDEESVRQHLAALRSLSSAAEELEVDDLPDEIDRTALLDEMRVRIFEFTHEAPHRRNPAFWLLHIFTGFHAVLVRGGGAAMAGKAGRILERLQDVPAFLDAARDTLKSPPLTFIDVALGMLGGGGELLVIMGTRAGEAAPELRADLDEATAKALVALRDFGKALGESIAPESDLQSFAVGEEQFNRRLRYEHALLAGAPELWRYGLHLREELEAQIVELARSLDPTRPWQEVAARLREEGEPDRSALVVTYRDVVADARLLCERRGLVALPQTPIVIERTPAFLVSTTPFSEYQPAPVYRPADAARVLVTALPHTVPHGLDEHAILLLRSRLAHDAWPGHHVQAATAHGLDREVRRHVQSQLTTEGWAQYAEDISEEAGLFPEPGARLLRQIALLWRAVRIDIDVGLHTKGLAPADAVNELVARLGMHRLTAEADVARCCLYPTYQLCAAVGRRELLQLRADVRARQGASFSTRRFHDALLSFGGLPIPLIRWGLGLE